MTTIHNETSLGQSRKEIYYTTRWNPAPAYQMQICIARQQPNKTTKVRTTQNGARKFQLGCRCYCNYSLIYVILIYFKPKLTYFILISYGEFLIVFMVNFYDFCADLSNNLGKYSNQRKNFCFLKEEGDSYSAGHPAATD